MALKKDNKVKSNFNRITIGLASPEEILERSSGEVLKPETVNYRTYKPERDGLFCERIFGPSKDYECHCGKYKKISYRGIVCDRCEVEVTEKKVRRERMGHIKLTVPVAHIWYFRSTPNKIGYLLGVPSKKLESVIYCVTAIVAQPGAATDIETKNIKGIKQLDMFNEDEYLEILDALPRENQMLPDDDPNKFIAGMGAEAIYTLLKGIDLDKLSYELRHKTESETSQQRKAEALKRLSVIEAFRESKDINKPEWMILKVIPVTPPDLRPLVPLDGGRFATSDLNELYRRVMGKKSVEDLHPVGSVGYCRELDKKDPEYHPGDRFREFYMRDESFEKGGFKYGTKVRIDTHDIRKTGLVCVQIGEYPLLALVQESADKVLFTFPNPFISCFSCSKQNLDQTVKFIGVPVFDT